MNLSLKQKLDKEANYRNSERELGFQASPDPIQIAHRHKDEYSALICALLAYGNAKAIVRYLEKLDFSLLDAEDENDILNAFFSPYRFQKPEDIRALFLALNRLKRRHSLNELFLEKFSHKNSVFSGVSYLQKAIYEATLR
ncbi:MAG: DUF2400 domain-containing protein, partial [Campylobacteraceae bacterium]|nr:DUF2400 domain-containing protein [Campylobacteraceae bacterium]